MGMNIWRRDWGSPGPVPLNRTDVQESFREEFCPLLDEGGSCGDFIGQEIKISQEVSDDGGEMLNDRKPGRQVPGDFKQGKRQ